MTRVTSDLATDQPTQQPPGPPEPGAAAPSVGHDAGWARTLARFGYLQRPFVGLRERLVPSFTDSTPYTGGGWLPCLLVTLMAGFLRFWNLGRPNAVIFDETYYAKDAWSLLHLGYEGTWPDNANDQIIAGHTQGLLSPDGSYIVHPPIGKWTISIGEWLFGLNPVGWRFMVALLGTLSILMLCRIGRRLFRSTLLGCIAGLLLALDGMHFVMSRTSLLDMVLTFWVLAAFGCLLIDRDQTRELIARRLGDKIDPDIAVRRLGARPWRIAAGMCLGLAVGTKWSGMYIIAAFGLLAVLWDVGARRTAGATRPYFTVWTRDALPAFFNIVILPLMIYIWSWSGWFVTNGGYFRHWADNRSGLSPSAFKVPVLGFSIHLHQFDMTWVPAPLRSLWHYHAQMWAFHHSLDSPHPYMSNAWSWMVLGRPVSYYYESKSMGQSGCTSSGGCAQEVLALGTPLLWWAGCAAALYCLYRWAARRDWRAGAILCGLAAGWLPWFNYQHRTIFLFYAVVFTPFIALAVAFMLGAMLGAPGSSDRRRAWGTAAVVAIIALIAWNFLYFYPIYTGQTISMSAWRARMWFVTWI